MCGLIALWDQTTPLEDATLDAGLAALRERGPDGDGRWVTQERDAAVGHTRLAVVDVAGGAQPLFSEDGAVVAALNGELYGADALRDALRARGHALRTRCDAELLVHLYEDHGPALVERLSGEFAFVLYDRRKRLLMGARDPDGVRPLLLARRGPRVLMASTARALFALGIPARWDERALAQSAALQYPPPGATLFAGVAPVPAGGAVFVDARGVRVVPPARRARELTQPSARREGREPTAALRVALDDAVRARVPDEVSFACALSGGLDSSAVLALVTRQRGTAPPAFTVRFDGDLHCEWELAAETARVLGAPHHEVRLGDTELAELLPAAARAGEGSAINAHLVGKWALAREVARAGHKVLLSGEGADEVTFGYAHFLMDAGFHPTGAQRATASGAMLTGVGSEAARGGANGIDAGTGAALPHFVEAKLALGARLHALGAFGSFDDNARAAVGALAGVVSASMGPDADAADPPHAASAAINARLERSRAWWRASAFERYILGTLGDAVELAHGVEGRPPFLDREVQRESARFSPLSFMRGGVEKQALRDALAGLLPEANLARRKQPFLASPMLLRERPGRLFDLAHATLTGARAPGFVNRAAVGERLEQLRAAPLAERREWEAPLMWLLTTALLERELLQ